MLQRSSSDPACVPAARAFARRQLAGIAEEVRERVALIVTELAANAVRHAGGEVTVAIRRQGATLRLEVGDGSERRPVRRHVGPSAVDGRGLLIVEALADRWGVEQQGVGKVVWVELSAAS